MINKKESIKETVTFIWIFRFIFILFSLYLLRDAFYRWDAFKHYASFSEFLPGLSLMVTHWSILSLITAVLIWLVLRAIEWFFQKMKFKLKREHVLIYAGIFFSVSGVLLMLKRHWWRFTPVSFQFKILALAGAALIAILIIWMIRNRAVRTIEIIGDRITPLVWIFGIVFACSLPFTLYLALSQDDGNVAFNNNDQSSVAANNDSPNIIMIVFDTLTAWDMSSYGYFRQTTPFINEWAKNASLFRRTISAGNFTTASTASLMTGKRIWTHRAFYLNTDSKPLKGDIESLPLVLRENGYNTMAFVANPYASASSLGITSGFKIAPDIFEFKTPRSLRGWMYINIHFLLSKIYGDNIKLLYWIIQDDFIFIKLINAISQHFKVTDVPPELIFNRFLKTIENNPQSPFFAWLHVYPPHDPYLPPEPFSGMFDDSSNLRTNASQLKALNNTFLHTSDNTVKVLRARYDEFIRYCDKQFEDFINKLEMREELKNTIIILTSDHGESFEHEYVGHGGIWLYEQVTHIPLIIKEPGQTEGRIINDLAGHIDITATIIDLAGIPQPSWMEGRSLKPLMQGKMLPSLPVFSMSLVSNPGSEQPITKGTIAVLEKDYKLIHYLDEDKSLLFNLKNDPDELKDLFKKEHPIAQRLLNLVHENINKADKEFLNK